MTPTPPRFPRGTDHYELANGLFHAIVLTLFERAPHVTMRASPDPLPEKAAKRKHRRVA